MENFDASLIVTLIGMSVIFVVLGILWATIMILEWVFPHQEPPAPKTEDEGEIVAVIQAAIAAYLKRRPENITITPVK